MENRKRLQEMSRNKSLGKTDIFSHGLMILWETQHGQTFLFCGGTTHAGVSAHSFLGCRSAAVVEDAVSQPGVGTPSVKLSYTLVCPVQVVLQIIL